MAIEQGRTGEVPLKSETEKKPVIDVVRVFPYAVASAETVISHIKEGLIVPGHEPILQILLAKKTAESSISPGMITPLGGRRKPDESKKNAAFRIAAGESTIALYPQKKASSSTDRGIHINSSPFRYNMVTDSAGELTDAKLQNYTTERRVSLIAAPAYPSDIMRGYFPGQEDKFDPELLPLTVEQLNELFKNGIHNGDKLVEHLKKGEPDGELVVMEPAQAHRRDLQLSALCRFLQTREDEIREKVLKALKCKTPTLTQAYYQLESQYGSDEASRRISSVLDGMRLDEYSSSFRNNEFTTFHHPSLDVRRPTEGQSLTIEDRLKLRAQKLRILLTTGNRGRDILHLLPVYIQSEKKAARLTHSYMQFEGFLRHAFDYAAEAVGLNWESAVSLLIQNQNEDLISERVDFKRRLNHKYIDTLAMVFKLPVEYVDDAWRQTQEFIPSLENTLRMENAQLQPVIRQAHLLRNEVNNAGVAEVVARYVYDHDPLVRFESGRQLFIFLKTLFGKEKYDKMRTNGNEEFKTAIEQFFGRPNREFDDLKINNNGFAIRSKSGSNVIIDEKPMKDWGSFFRKSLAESVENIHDVYAVNVVYAPQQGLALSPEDQVKATDDLADKFFNTLANVYFTKEKDYTVKKILDNKDSGKFPIDTYMNFLAGNISQEEISKTSGKRQGSKGDRIIRRKYVVVIGSPDGTERECEFSFYPFIELDEHSKQSGFMGWLDKIGDDTQYAQRRLLEPMSDSRSNIIGLQSFYGLFFPPQFYDFVPKTILPIVQAGSKVK